MIAARGSDRLLRSPAAPARRTAAPPAAVVPATRNRRRLTVWSPGQASGPGPPSLPAASAGPAGSAGSAGSAVSVGAAGSAAAARRRRRVNAPATAATVAPASVAPRETWWRDAAHTTASRPKPAKATSPTRGRRRAARATRVPMPMVRTTIMASRRGLSAVPTLSVAPRLRKPGVLRMTAWPTTATSDGTGPERASTRVLAARATAAARAPASAVRRAPTGGGGAGGRVSTFMWKMVPATASSVTASHRWERDGWRLSVWSNLARCFRV